MFRSGRELLQDCCPFMYSTAFMAAGWGLLLTGLVGCAPQPLPGDYGSAVRFQDHVQSNASPAPEQLAEMTLTTADGSAIRLSEIGGSRNILLVISRGLVGSLAPANAESHHESFCIFCSTQTSRLIANYAKFQERDTEVVVVFPVARQEDSYQLQKFAAKVQGEEKTTQDFPFPILLDVELVAVDALGIRDDLSKPATYIFDARGQLRFGYVGQSINDRPSIQAILEQLDQINQ